MKIPAILVFATLTAFSLIAQEPVNYRYTTETGFPSQELYDVVTDTSGYIWFASSEGLSRFDGLRTVNMKLSPKIRKSLSGLRVGPDGNIWCVNFDRQLLFTRGDSLILFNLLKDQPSFVLPRIVFIPDGRMAVSHSRGLAVTDLRTGNKQWIKYPGIDQYFFLDLVWSSKENKLILYDTGTGILSWTPSDTTLQKPGGSESFNHKTGAVVLVDSPQGVLFMTQSTYGIYIYRNRSVERLPVSDFLAQEKIWVTMGKYLDGHGLWFTSYDGVYHLQTVSDKIPDKIWFKGTQFSDVTEDAEGSLWFSALQDGLIQIPDENVFLISESNSILSDNSITSFSNGPGSLLFAGSYNGEVVAVDRETMAIRKTGFNNRKNVEALFYETSSGKLFVSSGGLWLVPDWKHGDRRISVQTSSVKQIRSDSEKQLWIASSGGIERISNSGDRQKDNGENFRLPSRHVIPLGRDSLLFASRGQLFLYQKGKPVVPMADGSGNDLDVTAFAENRHGQIWLSADRKGIYLFSNGKLRGPFREKIKLDLLSVRVMEYSDSIVWIGTNQGLYKMKQIDTDSISVSGPVIRREITALKIDSTFIWVGTGKGIIRIPKNYQYPATVPPIVRFETVSNDGKDTTVQKSYFLDNPPSVFSVGFSVPTYRNQGNYFFRYRILGLSDSWTETPAQSPSARLIGLAPGEYRIEVAAVNVENKMSPDFSVMTVIIPPPFWKTTWFLTVSFFAVLLSVFMVYRWQLNRYQIRLLQKQERESLQNELRLSQMSALTAQMNPHFIFNALSSIQSFIFKNDKLNANIYLGKFSDLIRSILRFSEEHDISLTDEIKALKLYLDLESLRFNGHLEWSLECSESINQDQIYLPSMIIQPYIENAIKHGLGHKQDDRKLKIRFDCNPDSDVLYVEIDDNGIGRKKSSEINSNRPGYHQSFAHSATEKRLEILNHSGKYPIGVSITDKENERQQSTGTLVKINIPVTRHE